MQSTTVNSDALVGAAQGMQLDEHTVNQFQRALVGDTITLKYPIDIGGQVLKAEVTITVTDEHKLFGDGATIYDVLGMIMRQVAETRLS